MAGTPFNNGDVVLVRAHFLGKAEDVAPYGITFPSGAVSDPKRMAVHVDGHGTVVVSDTDLISCESDLAQSVDKLRVMLAEAERDNKEKARAYCNILEVAERLKRRVLEECAKHDLYKGLTDSRIKELDIELRNAREVSDNLRAALANANRIFPTTAQNDIRVAELIEANTRFEQRARDAEKLAAGLDAIVKSDARTIGDLERKLASVTNPCPPADQQPVQPAPAPAPKESVLERLRKFVANHESDSRQVLVVGVSYLHCEQLLSEWRADTRKSSAEFFAVAQPGERGTLYLMGRAQLYAVVPSPFLGGDGITVEYSVQLDRECTYTR